MCLSEIIASIEITSKSPSSEADNKFIYFRIRSVFIAKLEEEEEDRFFFLLLHGLLISLSLLQETFAGERNASSILNNSKYSISLR